MKYGIYINGIDRDAVKEIKDSILDVLEASLEHRNPDVTEKALDVLGGAMSRPINLNSCNINGDKK